MTADDGVLARALDLLARSETCVIGSFDRDGYPTLRAFLRPRRMDGM